MRLYIPEARKVERIRNKLSEHYIRLSTCYNSFQISVYNMNIANLSKEMTNIGSIIKDKYLSVGQDNTNRLQSIEEYIKNVGNIDDIFEVLYTKLKKPGRDYTGKNYNSTNYIKLMDELGIEIMYTNWPVRRNVVRISDIDNIIYSANVRENYYF